MLSSNAVAQQPEPEIPLTDQRYAEEYDLIINYEVPKPIRESIDAYRSVLTAISVVATLLSGVHIGFLSAMLTLQDVDLTLPRWQCFKYIIYIGTICSIAATMGSMHALIRLSSFAFTARRLAHEDPDSLPYTMLHGKRIDLDYVTNWSKRQALLQGFGMSQAVETMQYLSSRFLVFGLAAGFTEVMGWALLSEGTYVLAILTCAAVFLSALALSWASSRGAPGRNVWRLITGRGGTR